MSWKIPVHNSLKISSIGRPGSSGVVFSSGTVPDPKTRLNRNPRRVVKEVNLRSFAAKTVLLALY